VTRATSAEIEASLKAKCEGLGLATAGLEIKFDNGKISLEGAVSDKEVRAKIIVAMGSNDGIATISQEITTQAPPTPPARVYTVVKGDIPSKISKAHSGDPNKHNKIFEAIEPMLAHPDKIYPGQVLRLARPTRRP